MIAEIVTVELPTCQHQVLPLLLDVRPKLQARSVMGERERNPVMVLTATCPVLAMWVEMSNCKGTLGWEVWSQLGDPTQPEMGI
jgi:hypothetical protein